MTNRRDRRSRIADVRRVWEPYLDDLAGCVAVAEGVELFLHLPKTGGSAFMKMVGRAPGWQGLDLYAPSEQKPPCWCARWNACTCADAPDPVGAARARIAGQRLVISAGHVTVDQVDWLRRVLERRGATVRVTSAAVRPVRDRLRSMFRFYCTYALDPADDATLAQYAPARRATVLVHRADVIHYLRSDGSLDGSAWFAEFARSTGGVRFFLDDSFGSVRRLRRSLGRGLVAVPAARLDEYCHARFGAAPLRVNVSASPESDPRIAAALAEAQDALEVCARRDAPYDAVLAEHLGDGSFAP